MKIIIVIPHYYKYDAKSVYGSSSEGRAERAKVLSRMLNGLNALFVCPHGHSELTADDAGNYFFVGYPANAATRHRIDFFLCTSGENHLLGELEVDSSVHWQQVNIDVADPRYLGFGCHQLLRQYVGKYDYYCYMEDDLLIHDVFFFRKLKWFESAFGSRCILQPHRYIGGREPYAREYIDPALPVVDKLVDFGDGNPENLRLSYLGEELVFRRSHTAHAGGFWLSAAQYELMARRGDYAAPKSDFIGPLESAATLDILRTFAVYEADFPWADFLSLEHIGQNGSRYHDYRIDKSAFAALGYDVS